MLVVIDTDLVIKQRFRISYDGDKRHLSLGLANEVGACLDRSWWLSSFEDASAQDFGRTDRDGCGVKCRCQ